MGLRGGGSCAAARKCCDGKDPDCAVPSVSEEDASKRHGGKKTEKLLTSIDCKDLLYFIQNCLLFNDSSSGVLFLPLNINTLQAVLSFF